MRSGAREPRVCKLSDRGEVAGRMAGCLREREGAGAKLRRDGNERRRNGVVARRKEGVEMGMRFFWSSFLSSFLLLALSLPFQEEFRSS
jgi:hypothetical protein